MARDVSLMVVLFQMLVVFLLLLVIGFTVPKLKPLLSTATFLFVLLYLLTAVLFPFGKMYVQLFEAMPNPYVKLLIGSAFLFFISELVASHIEEAGYEALAKMSHLAVKITILLLWIDQTRAVIDVLSALITK